LDSSGGAVNVDIVWAVSDSLAGKVNQNGEFTAKKAGLVLVIATVGALSDTSVVTITEPPAPVPASVAVSPDSAEAEVGDEVEFAAAVKDSSGEEVKVNVAWAVADTAVGSINEDGVFKGLKVGVTMVIATVGALSDTSVVTVTEAEEPPVDPNKPAATFYRNKDGKLTKFGEPVVDGGTITMGGMPSPFNFLNGMKLTFPEGSLKENITITISVPKFAKVEKDSVIFNGKLLTGVTFEVAVNDTVKSPYYFGKPIEVSLPFKKGLMTNLGIKPEDVGMFFASDSGVIEADPGITDTEVDAEDGTATGQVAHFSTIVLAPKSAAPLAVNEQAPAAFALSQNVPNPFNPATTISFAVPATGMVRLTVFNVLGQEVRTLVNGQLASGSHSIVWNGRDEMGRAATSGVYFYRLEAGSLTATKKLMLLR
ncbi:MAG: FlgD immunoglobulin-like domain containing protein, partial [Candidatus Latescibacterota bacterium]